MSLLCISCKKVCADYQELALHIASSKNGHRNGKRWAAKYLVGVKNRQEFKGRIPLTDIEKKSKLDTVREMSGSQESVVAICPRCKRRHRESLPIEYTQSRDAWHIQNSVVVMCPGCK